MINNFDKFPLALSFLVITVAGIFNFQDTEGGVLLPIMAVVSYAASIVFLTSLTFKVVRRHIFNGVLAVANYVATLVIMIYFVYVSYMTYILYMSTDL